MAIEHPYFYGFSNKSPISPSLENTYLNIPKHLSSLSSNIPRYVMVVEYAPLRALMAP